MCLELYTHLATPSFPLSSAISRCGCNLKIIIVRNFPMRDEPGCGEDKVLERRVTWPAHVTSRHAPAACFPLTWSCHVIMLREPAAYSRCSPYHRELSSSTTWYTFLVCFFRNFQNERTFLFGEHAGSLGRRHADRVSSERNVVEPTHSATLSSASWRVWCDTNLMKTPSHELHKIACLSALNWM